MQNGLLCFLEDALYIDCVVRYLIGIPEKTSLDAQFPQWGRRWNQSIRITKIVQLSSVDFPGLFIRGIFLRRRLYRGLFTWEFFSAGDLFPETFFPPTI